MTTRIKVALNAAQSVDQAGFRKGFGCDDHLFAVVQLIEKMSEYNCTLWICAIDFRKAFDSVEHLAIWKALHAQGVQGRYIDLLQRLYRNQVGRITMQRESKQFKITRGTKQGDPMSPSIFNAVLEELFGKLKVQWESQGSGLDLGQKERLTNLRFADDVLLVASSRSQLQNMIEGLMVEASAVGLEMHMGKTKILSNTGAAGHLTLRGHGASCLMIRPALAWHRAGAADSPPRRHGASCSMLRPALAWRRAGAAHGRLGIHWERAIEVLAGAHPVQSTERKAPLPQSRACCSRMLANGRTRLLEWP